MGSTFDADLRAVNDGSIPLNDGREWLTTKSSRDRPLSNAPRRYRPIDDFQPVVGQRTAEYPEECGLLKSGD